MIPRKGCSTLECQEVPTAGATDHADQKPAK